MSRALGLFAIGLVFGGGIGFVVAAGNGITFDGHDHSDAASHAGMDDGEGHDMAHDTLLEVTAAEVPTLEVTVAPDPVQGYNLKLAVKHFTFMPTAAGFEHVSGEGHAHVYVNGDKLGRLYGEWMHIASLPHGEVDIEVTLNSNNHSQLAVAGKPVTASTRLVVE
ncbi:MAG: hypothetical protein WBG95_13035 [Sulfitobacter sp.]